MSADLGTAGASVAAISWQRLLQALARERAAALRRRDPALLDRVYLAGSGAGTADRATVMQLRRRGVIPRGLRIRVGPVRPLDGEAAGSAAPGNGASAVVEMVSTVSSYRLVDAATGSTVDVAPASPGHAIRVTLRHTGGGWRIAALGPG